MTDGGRAPRHPTSDQHDHQGALYEAVEYLDAPPDEPIPEREVSLARRILNWKTIASVIFAFVVLFLAFQTLGVNLGRTWSLILQANLGFLALAFLAYYLTFPIRGFRWRYILARTGTRVGLRDATEILFLS